MFKAILITALLVLALSADECPQAKFNACEGDVSKGNHYQLFSLPEM